jgi:serine/threonine-protein kinase
MVFANHRLERVLGQGGMGMVWFGRHLTLDRPAAIKVRLGGADDVIGRERFLREARTCAQVRHPHVIGIHDAGVVDGIEYLAMDYVEGGSLADRLRLYLSSDN